MDGDGAVEVVTGGYYYDSGNNAQLVVWSEDLTRVENIATWNWGTNTLINSVEIADVDLDGSVEVVTRGYYYDSGNNAQLAVWDGVTLAVDCIKTWHWIGGSMGCSA